MANGPAVEIRTFVDDAIASDQGNPDLFPPEAPATPGPVGDLSETQQSILGGLDEPRTPDELAASTGLDAGALRAELTMLEIAGRVRRAGSRFERAR